MTQNIGREDPAGDRVEGGPPGGDPAGGDPAHDLTPDPAGDLAHGGPLGGGDPVGEVLAALVDPTRRRVLDAVATRGQATATILAAELPVSRQAVVKHLAVLDRAGLVEGRRAGREVRYAVRSERLADTARWMARVAAEWDDRLATIKRLAESGDP
jgi:DNA-binding transcriptional ArsR family regulator